jgi:hypothetical protein
LANEVASLSKKILNETFIEIDPIYLNFESNQKTELLSQLLDEVF